MTVQLPGNIDEIIKTFNLWYERDPHSSNEDMYKEDITYEKINGLSNDDLVVFFENFTKNGGGLQSGGQRTSGLLAKNIKENVSEFKVKVLEPFSENFDVLSWLDHSFKYFGQGIASIYLNRVDKEKYCVVNDKSIEAYEKLGFKIRKSPLINCYEDLRLAEKQLINLFPYLENFYKADSLSHFLIGTDLGEQMLNEKNTGTLRPFISSSEEKAVNSKKAINRILFGPPGTGKTFNTINHAIEIINPKLYESIINSNDSELTKREQFKKEFDRLLISGQIAFTTFHQSFGYEDFVEGIKVEKGEKGIEYYIEPGVFKALCENSVKQVERLDEANNFDLRDRRIWKMSLGDTQTDEGDRIYRECIDNGYVLLGYGDDLDFSGCNSVEAIKKKFIDSGRELKNQDYQVTAVNTFVNKMKHGDIIIITDGNHKYRAIAEITGDYEKLTDDRDHWFQMRKVKWHLSFEPSQLRENLFKLAFSQMTLYELKENTLNRNALQELLEPIKEDGSDNGANNGHVLIIDEINRGNISKIFGELITLIEPNKRKGADEALSVTLPYSKKPFSVPQNIHIIGTMNTADASIAKLDVALRRRFDFIEMSPKPELLTDDKTKNGQTVIVDEVILSKMLSKINERIELLYDRDHTIGHSFFMGLTNKSEIDDLANVFEKNIIPLLQEYFFEDWERIHWVLDCLKDSENISFVKKKGGFNSEVQS